MRLKDQMSPDERNRSFGARFVAFMHLHPPIGCSKMECRTVHSSDWPCRYDAGGGVEY